MNNKWKSFRVPSIVDEQQQWQNFSSKKRITIRTNPRSILFFDPISIDFLFFLFPVSALKDKKAVKLK
jgi:hypothetical protein